MDHEHWDYFHDNATEIGRHAAVGFVTAQNVFKAYAAFLNSPSDENKTALQASIDLYILKHGNVCIGCPTHWCVGCIPEVDVDEVPDANRTW